MRRKLAWALLPVMFLALSGLTHARSWSREQVYRAGYQHGFRDGLHQGAFDYRNGGYRGLRPHAYRDDAGYSGSMGHRGDYRKGYREGFRAGYSETAYGRGRRRYLRYGSWNPSEAVYPDNGRTRTGHSFAYEQGMNLGYREGTEKGMEDYRKNRGYDPSRHDKYRDADDGYKSSYGNRRDYEAGYRQGFEDGYRQTFRR